MNRLCKCGCGNIVGKNSSYLRGHNSRGESCPMRGKKHSDKTKIKIGLSNKGKHNNSRENSPMWGKHHSEETIKKIIESNRKKGNYERISERMKNGGALKSRMANRISPNKPEKLMIDLIEKNNMPFNYVGDGKVWFEGETQSFNPDFLSKNPKHIIELFGDYWHKNTQIKDKERLDTYHKLGYKTLVIWEHELKNTNQIIEKIKEFIKDEKGK